MDRLQSLKDGCEGVGEAPHSARLELLSLGLEVNAENSSSEMPWSSQLALDGPAANDRFDRYGRELLLASSFHLLARWLAIPLHSIHSNREAVLK